MPGEFSLISDFQNSASDTPEIAYSADVNTLITAFTVTNNTSVNRSYKAYIYDVSGSPSGAVAPLTFVKSNSGYSLVSPLIGHIVPAGGTIRVESSLNDTLIFTATGREA